MLACVHPPCAYQPPGESMGCDFLPQVANYASVARALQIVRDVPDEDAVFFVATDEAEIYDEVSSSDWLFFPLTTAHVLAAVADGYCCRAGQSEIILVKQDILSGCARASNAPQRHDCMCRTETTSLHTR